MSDTPNTLYTALLAAQRAMGPVKKDASNPAFRTKYATLQSVLETVEGPLSENGLVLLQRFEPGGEWPLLVTEIVHAATGGRIASAVPVVSKDPHDPQKVGGAITYYRRYSLLALLGLAPEDDDGHGASQPRSQPQAARPAPTQQRPAQPQPAPQAPFTAERFGRVIDALWGMFEDGKPYAQMVDELNAARPQMTAEQKEIARLELPKLRAAIAERDAPMAPAHAGAAG